MKRAALVVASAGLVVAGCAADSKQAPRSPSQESGASASYPSLPSSTTSPGAAPSQPDAAPSMPVQPGPFAPAPEMRLAQEDFEKGRRELESTGGGQCKDACRALSSMDRAAGKICGLESGDRCVGVKDKLYSARDRVHLSCGTCSDGTSTDRNAPVPSR